jgi:Na+-translocating ferredoxin:NAD+ oxidoreductase RnfG subunit
MASKFKTAIVLVIIAAFSGLSIFAVNDASEPGILENRRIREENNYKAIFGLDESVVISFEKTTIEDGLEEIEILDASDQVIGYIYKGENQNNYGEVVVLVGILPNQRIESVIISSTTNTPNYVNKIKGEILDNFAGQAVDEVTFDSKTGASFTYGSVKNTVIKATEYYEQNRGDIS